MQLRQFWRPLGNAGKMLYYRLPAIFLLKLPKSNCVNLLAAIVNAYLSSYDAICLFVGNGVTEEGEASDVSGIVTVF